MRPTPRVAAAGAATCLAITAALASTTGSAAAASARSSLPGHQPSWANSKALRSAAPTTDTVHLRVYLPWRNAAGLQQVAHDVSTPGSPSYHAFLTPQQFHAAYSPKQSDVAAVQNWLRGQGFSIADVPSNGHYVAVEGTVAQAQTAFGTTLGLYTAYGRTLRAPESAPSVPSSLKAAVSAVVGLDDSPRLQAPDNRRDAAPNQSHGAPGVGFRAGRPCSTSFGEKNVTTSFTAYGTKSKPLAPCGYTPAQVRGLYGLTDPTGGTGQTVAFVGANASPTLTQDVTQYSRLHSLPDPSITQLVAPGIYRHPDTVRQVPGDFYGEETLDAEAIHSTAPGAHLLYVASSNANQDFDASINHIVDKRLAPIISISYGFNGEAVPRGFITSLNNTFLQAVATGIGVYVSSGDNGDDASSTGTTAVDFYADSPNVTAVGGTSAAIVPGTATGTGTKASGAPAARSSRAAPDTYGVDNPASPLNQPGWARSFEVGWQTGFSPVSNPVLTGSGRAFALTGTLPNGTPGSFFGGAGGGVSKVFPQPSCQQGVTDAVTDGSTGATGRTGRAVPDISAVGDPNTGFLVGQTQAFSDGTYYDEYRIGGTSVSAPLMAGMAAVANQRAGAPLGLLNPRIYDAYRTSAATAFYDVDQRDLFPAGAIPSEIRVNYKDSESAANGRSFSLRTLEEPNQSLHSVRGYDTATGVGTPTGDGFFLAVDGK